ncbi:MAG: phosphotransferase [Alphaproteobacteria bacterium]|nr:phosphotransferase [Alphaproteobacteria bacterium]
MSSAKVQEISADVAAQRKMRRERFLHSLDLPPGVEMEALPADASFRCYYRLHGTARPMLMMEDPPDRPDVAGPVMVEPFTKIARHLLELGLRAPEIYFRAFEDGLLILEDFGGNTFTRLFDKGTDPRPLYEQAVDVLVHLHRHPKCNDIDLPPYDTEALLKEAALMVDWYLPMLAKQDVPDDVKQSFMDVWRGILDGIPQEQKVVVLLDYHVDNLMRAPGGTGIKECGLLDFQNAAIGHPAYDLMSLLEDARRDMPDDLRKHLFDRYVAQAGSGFDKDSFERGYRILAAQRHAKVLGIFVRLHQRDNKSRYLQFLPHVHKLFTNALAAPEMEPLRTWFGAHKELWTDDNSSVKGLG